MKQSLGNLYGYTTPPGADGLLVTGFTLTKDAQDLRIQVDDVTVWYGSAKANEKIELHTLVGSDGFSIEYTSLSTKESIPGTLFFRPH